MIRRIAGIALGPNTFRMIDGKYRYIHTLSVNLNPNQPSPQADDNGEILR